MLVVFWLPDTGINYRGTAERRITLAGYLIADIILWAADQLEAQRKFMGR